MKQYPNITISREYGSGGHEVGELVAKKLGLPFYDNELITIASRDSGIAEKHFHEAELSAKTSFGFALGMMGSGQYGMPLNNRLYSVQASLIRTIADQGPAVFVGRCADYVLKGYKPCLDIFIQCEHFDSRVERVMRRNNLTEAEARERIKMVDKCRATYYSFYTSMKWGKRENHDLILDTHIIGVEGTADVIALYVNKYMENL